ncbi:MAG: 30S ribosome-binding factor RbfA [Myxococcota bacterium]
MSIRSERIAEQIRAELDSLLRQETSDPRVGLLTLTRVKVSSDLGSAIVFWSPFAVDAVDDLDEVAAGLESAVGFLRGRLAKRLSLRRMPTLSFRYDPSLKQGSETLAILRGLPEARVAKGGETESGDHGT